MHSFNKYRRLYAACNCTRTNTATYDRCFGTDSNLCAFPPVSVFPSHTVGMLCCILTLSFNSSNKMEPVFCRSIYVWKNMVRHGKMPGVCPKSWGRLRVVARQHIPRAYRKRPYQLSKQLLPQHDTGCVITSRGRNSLDKMDALFEGNVFDSRGKHGSCETQFDFPASDRNDA